MATKNTLVKKLVLELFSAVCVYSTIGYEATLDALDYFKVLNRFMVALKSINVHWRNPLDVQNKNSSLFYSDIRDEHRRYG